MPHTQPGSKASTNWRLAQRDNAKKVFVTDLTGNSVCWAFTPEQATKIIAEHNAYEANQATIAALAGKLLEIKRDAHDFDQEGPAAGSTLGAGNDNGFEHLEQLADEALNLARKEA